MPIWRILLALAAGIVVLAGYAWLFGRAVGPMPDNWLTDWAMLFIGLGAIVLPGAAFWVVLVKTEPRGPRHGD